MLCFVNGIHRINCAKTKTPSDSDTISIICFHINIYVPGWCVCVSWVKWKKIPMYNGTLHIQYTYIDNKYMYEKSNYFGFGAISFRKCRDFEKIIFSN